MTYNDANTVRDGKFRFYFEELERLSVRLFTARLEGNEQAYGMLFDNLPVCQMRINVPLSCREFMKPTGFMAFREARFVLGPNLLQTVLPQPKCLPESSSDLEEHQKLDDVWQFLHDQVIASGGDNAQQLAGMWTLNHTARELILEQQDAIRGAIRQCEDLLTNDRYEQATDRADEVLKEVTRVVEGIINSYANVAPLPH